MCVPAELAEIIYIDDSFSAELHWHIAIERRMHTIIVVLFCELFKLSVQVTAFQKM